MPCIGIRTLATALHHTSLKTSGTRVVHLGPAQVQQARTPLWGRWRRRILFGKPAYQAGVAGIPSDGHAMFRIFHSVRRDTTDTSFASGKAQMRCDTESTFSSWSGTSASTPSFAGVMSLVDQKTGSRQGLANIVLYHLAAGETFAQLQCLDARARYSASGQLRFQRRDGRKQFGAR